MLANFRKYEGRIFRYCIIEPDDVNTVEEAVDILEKEKAQAEHGSGRNSGVLHAGFYYTADSLKAKFTKEGNQLVRQLRQGSTSGGSECSMALTCIKTRGRSRETGNFLSALKNLPKKLLKPLVCQGLPILKKLNFLSKKQLKWYFFVNIDPYAFVSEQLMALLGADR